jgi:hypothetical protein
MENMITMIATIHGGWMYGAMKMKESISTAARRSPRWFIIRFFVGLIGIRVLSVKHSDKFSWMAVMIAAFR